VPIRDFAPDLGREKGHTRLKSQLFTIERGSLSFKSPAFIFISAALLLAGCGSSSKAPAPVAPAIADKPDVIITFDGERHTCVVALYSEPQGSLIPCADIIPFMRDELRLASGSIYDTRTIAKFEAAEVGKTIQSLKEAGYVFIGGH
jgi:hypothetical protein